MDSKADMVCMSNGERAIIDVMHRLASGEKSTRLRDVRGAAHFIDNKHNKAAKAKFVEIAM